MIKKNTAGQFIYFVLVQASDGAAHTGQTPSGYQAIDGAAQGAIGGAIAENANGQYEVALSQGDTNGDEIGYLFTNTGSIPVSITVTTETKKMADLNDLAVGALMGLSDDAITASKYDESTAFPVASADTGASQIARVGADGDTLESLSDEIAALPTDADVNAACDTALSDIHLDHLLGVTYDPASKPGAADALLNEMVESDGGVSRFTANALEEGPDAGDATEAKQDEILTDIVDIKGTAFAKDTDSLVNLAHTGADSDTLEILSDEIAALPTDADVNAQVDAALVTYHLDHLLHTAYAGEGAAGSLLSDLVEDDGGTYRFTANTLEEAAVSGGDATAANQTLILEDIVDMKGTGFVKDTDSLIDLAHIGADADTLEDISDEIAAVASSLATTDGKVDDILEDTGTTLDGIVDSILEDTGTTLDGKVDTIDGIVDFLKQVLEGDRTIDTGETPWQFVIKDKTSKAALVTKNLTEVDTTNITAVTQQVGNEIEPA